MSLSSSRVDLRLHQVHLYDQGVEHRLSTYCIDDHLPYGPSRTVSIAIYI